MNALRGSVDVQIFCCLKYFGTLLAYSSEINLHDHDSSSLIIENCIVNSYFRMLWSYLTM